MARRALSTPLGPSSACGLSTSMLNAFLDGRRSGGMVLARKKEWPPHLSELRPSFGDPALMLHKTGTYHLLINRTRLRSITHLFNINFRGCTEPIGLEPRRLRVARTPIRRSEVHTTRPRMLWVDVGIAVRNNDEHRPERTRCSPPEKVDLRGTINSVRRRPYRPYWPGYSTRRPT